MARRFWKRLLYRPTGHIRLAVLTLAVLLVLCIVKSVWTSCRYDLEIETEDADFYHMFPMPDDEPYRRLLANPESEPIQHGRERTVNTSYGPVYVRDLLFIPEKQLPKGSNVYRLKRGDQELQHFSRPANHSELDKLVKELRFAKRNMISKVLNRAERRGGLELLPEEVEGLQRRRRDSVIAPDPSTCRGPPCIQLLSITDIPHYRFCVGKSELLTEPPATTCSFRQQGPYVPLMALASPPASGADTLRWLLQELTGLCTGSTTCNPALRRAGYAGECLRSTTVLVVKTEQGQPFWSGTLSRKNTAVPRGFRKMSDVPVFDGAVYLLRNPFHSILDHWNELHTTTLNADLKWEGFVLEQMVAWQKTLVQWTVNSQDHPVLVVQYEKLIQNLKRELVAILDFLHVPYSSGKLAGVSWGGGHGKRKEQLADFFHVKEVSYVNSVLKEVANVLQNHSHTRDINITSYFFT